MKKVAVITVSLFVLTGFVSAQRFKPQPDFLKGETEINLIFNYENVTYDEESQTEYYKDKGASWVEEWEGKRRENNNLSFSNSLNDELEKINISTGEYPEAQYTMIVDVLDCDFGAFAGPFSATAELECTIRIVKTGTAQTLASVTLEESQNPYSVIGTPIDFDRMYLAFGEVEEEIGDILVKRLKK